MNNQLSDNKLKIPEKLTVVPYGECLLKELGINSSAIKSIKSIVDRQSYRAIINWLSGYQSKPEKSSLEQVKGCLEALHHLCLIQLWLPIQPILELTVMINPIEADFTLALYEYFLFTGLERQLLEISEKILYTFQGGQHDLGRIPLFRIYAASDILPRSESFTLSQEFCEKLSPTSPIYIEAIIVLVGRQSHLGSYDQALQNINIAFQLLETKSHHISQKQYEIFKISLLNCLGWSNMNLNRFAKAIKFYRESLDLIKKYKLPQQKQTCLLHLGVIHRKIKNYADAIIYLEEAIELARLMKSQHLALVAEHHLAYAYLYQGQYDQAASVCQKCLKQHQLGQHASSLADCYEQIGLIQVAQGYGTMALSSLEKSLTIRRQIGNRHGIASSLKHLSLVFGLQRKYLKSMQYLLKSLQAYAKIGILNPIRFWRILSLFYAWISRR
jgi:tetratricopeptide (TPR) repeat protein